MTRRLAVAAAIVAALAGSAGAAAATGPTQQPQHQLCVVIAKDVAHHHTQDYCIDWSGATGRS